MYTKEQLKQMHKKANKLKNSLFRAYTACNSTVYTEQNTEELNSVKEYVAFKIDLLTGIICILETALKDNNGKISAEQISELNELKQQFNTLSKDKYLSRLQQIYTRKVNAEFVSI